MIDKKEKFCRETLAAYEEYVSTGLFISHEEANAWLENLAKGIITEPPTPKKHFLKEM